MKQNIERLTMFVMTVAMATCSMVAFASDDQPANHRIHGDYVVTGSAQCLVAVTGFSSASSTVLSPTGPWVIQTIFYEGAYTFQSDGVNGSAVLNGRTITSPIGGVPGSPLVGSPSASTNKLTFDFTYTVDAEGHIVFTTVPGSDVLTSPTSVAHLSTGPRTGDVSSSGQMLLVHCGAPVVIDVEGTPQQLVCNISLAGFRRHD